MNISFVRWVWKSAAGRSCTDGRRWWSNAHGELAWGAAATTPTAGSSRRWAAGSWCCPWARLWGRAAACTPGGLPPDGTSPGPWAPRGRRCSSGWPRPRFASPPSVPSRLRLAGCRLWREVSGHHDSAGAKQYGCSSSGSFCTQQLWIYYTTQTSVPKTQTEQMP